MLLLTGISDSTPRSLQIKISGQPDAVMTMRFYPTQNQWYFDIVWGSTFTCYGMVLVYSINLLGPWENILPFGIACLTSDGIDPVGQEAFTSSGNASLYLLSSTDITTNNAALLPGN